MNLTNDSSKEKRCFNTIFVFGRRVLLKKSVSFDSLQILLIETRHQKDKTSKGDYETSINRFKIESHEA